MFFDKIYCFLSSSDCYDEIYLLNDLVDVVLFDNNVTVLRDSAYSTVYGWQLNIPVSICRHK